MSITIHSQDTARKVYDHVQDAKSKSYEGDYRQLCKKMPILVMTSGLSQAVALLGAKAAKSKAHEQLRLDLAQTLNITDGDIGAYLLESKWEEYMQLTQRALEAGYWYKRFSESLLVPGDEI